MFLTGSVSFPLPSTVDMSVKRLYPRCAGQLQALESATLDVDNPKESILHTYFAVLLLLLLLLLFILISRRALINIYSLNLSTSYHVFFFISWRYIVAWCIAPFSATTRDQTKLVTNELRRYPIFLSTVIFVIKSQYQ